MATPVDERPTTRGWSFWLRWGGVAAVVLAVAIQVVPYGHGHANPTATGEPNWPSAQVRQLAVTACYDCHSDQVKWPWYSNVAPVSWWVQHHVDEGRARLNFSEWNTGGASGDLAEVVRRGSMPPTYYTLMHGGAHLSSSQKDELVKGLLAIEGTGVSHHKRGEGGEGGE